MDTPQKPLKRLGFVASGASYVASYTTTAESMYKTVRSVVPSFAEPTLAIVEDKVAAAAAPVLVRATDLGEKMLYMADGQVDYVLDTADKTFAGGKKGVYDGASGVMDMHRTNMKTFRSATVTYFEGVKYFADWAKDKLNPIKAGQVALDTLNLAIARAQEATDPDVAAKMAVDAWTAFASVPVVAKVLDTTDPVTKSALNSFYRVHDTLVSSPMYGTAVNKGTSTLSWAATTTPYKLGAQYLYPWVQPVADPALSRITNSRVINTAVGYWKPAALTA